VVPGQAAPVGLAVAAFVDPQTVAGDQVGAFGECADQDFGAGHGGLLK
jgi:hypothetical protein